MSEHFAHRDIHGKTGKWLMLEYIIIVYEEQTMRAEETNRICGCIRFGCSITCLLIIHDHVCRQKCSETVLKAYMDQENLTYQAVQSIKSYNLPNVIGLYKIQVRLVR